MVAVVYLVPSHSRVVYSVLTTLLALSPPTDHASALDALRDAIENLDQLFAAIGEAYDQSLSAGNFETHVEPKLDHERLAQMAEEGKKRRAEEQAKDAEARRQAAQAAAGHPM